MKRVLAPLLLFAATGAGAAEFERIEVRHVGDIYFVNATAILAADSDSLRYVITDYRHMHWITGAVLKARVLETPEPGVSLIRVRSRACFSVFCKTIEQTQLADARSAQRIVFTSLPELSDVKQAETVWTLSPLTKETTRIEWSTYIEPDFWIPPLIGDSLIESGLADEGRDMINGLEKLARERGTR